MKVYKITLYVSLIVFSILTVLSVVLNLWNDNEWIVFGVNWCVGIACSIVVVIITTLIQFKIEQKKIIRELASETRTFLFRYKLRDIALEKNPHPNYIISNQFAKFEQIWFDQIDESATKIYELCSNLHFLIKNKKQLSLLKHSILIVSSIVISKEKTDYFDRVLQHADELAKIMLEFDISKYDRDEIEKHVKAHQNTKKTHQNL